MDEKQVEVIKKVDGPVIRDRRKMGKPLTITRKRVAAYVRVSTNGEEQIQSFNSQKQYYQDKMCGSSMYADIVQWKNKDGKVMRKIKYQCGHYAKSKFGQCQKNTIPAEWIEAEVIEYTKLLVRNKQFAEDIQGQLGHKTDVSEIDKELDNYHKMIKKLKKVKAIWKVI